MRSHELRSIVIATSLAGCTGIRAPDDTPPPPPPGPPAITGVNRTIHWDEQGGSLAVGEPPDDVFIEAELSDESRPAALAEDGTFSIAGPPPVGPYWLRFIEGKTSREDVYLWTDATVLDLSRDAVGAPSALATSADTRVIVNAPGLSPWQDTDDGDVMFGNLGHWSDVVTFYAANTPIAGDTSLTDLTYVWQSEPLAPSGADAIFTQVRSAHDDALGLDYVSPVKAFHSDPVALLDATTSQVSGTFADPPALDVPIHWARTEFFAQADAMHGATCQHDLEMETYWVHAIPGHGEHGEPNLPGGIGLTEVPEFGPRVVEVPFLEGTDDLNGTFHVANPYPPDWLYAKYAALFSVACPLPDGRTPGNAEAEIGVLTNDLRGTLVTPLVGPVSAPTIAGRDLTVPQINVGATPTLSWTAPAIGTPTSFEVHLSEVDTSGTFGGGLVLHEDAVLIVPGDVTSITLPPDVLATDTVYTIRIRAVMRTGQAARTAPFRAGMPLGYADLFTNYFQP